ncbi:hypothetical protein PPERSA_07890 [Pseudocohnilembus persalinus]|uniref:RING-type domain-containing protein n=1 Tax=Pseudocohnilembus persalinus TaxID=266149 RepID=A0A0V0QC54_PSEPJ|nr:hypothetical protein PPERSA_07890 [Pseudocohnilembus persalinus]|eukprot:KRW99813.1 hypothetical protein PPERSA_07890 [Pseudocohnilembus persalinus]
MEQKFILMKCLDCQKQNQNQQNDCQACQNLLKQEEKINQLIKLSDSQSVKDIMNEIKNDKNKQKFILEFLQKQPNFIENTFNESKIQEEQKSQQEQEKIITEKQDHFSEIIIQLKQQLQNMKFNDDQKICENQQNGEIEEQDDDLWEEDSSCSSFSEENDSEEQKIQEKIIEQTQNQNIVYNSQQKSNIFVSIPKEFKHLLEKTVVSIKDVGKKIQQQQEEDDQQITQQNAGVYDYMIDFDEQQQNKQKNKKQQDSEKNEDNKENNIQNNNNNLDNNVNQQDQQDQEEEWEDEDEYDEEDDEEEHKYNSQVKRRVCQLCKNLIEYEFDYQLEDHLQDIHKIKPYLFRKNKSHYMGKEMSLQEIESIHFDHDWDQIKHKKKLDPKIIEKLPQEKFQDCKSKFKDIVNSENKPFCSICIQEYSDDEVLMLLPCNHSYHKEIKNYQKILHKPRIELGANAWKASMLPLHHLCLE